MNETAKKGTYCSFRAKISRKNSSDCHENQLLHRKNCRVIAHAAIALTVGSQSKLHNFEKMKLKSLEVRLSAKTRCKENHPFQYTLGQLNTEFYKSNINRG